MNVQYIFCKYPKLRNDKMFKLIDPYPGQPLSKYNCFAYALGKTDAFWAYNAEWPPDVPRRPEFPDHIDGYIELFTTFGYASCSALSGVRPDHFDQEEGLEKVALYAKENSANGITYLQCPHVAKQLPSGNWSSKNNQFDIFEHAPESLESESGSTNPHASPTECREPRPDGGFYIHQPMNYGRVVLVMSRSAMGGQ
jgi:hypothetical protein